MSKIDLAAVANSLHKIIHIVDDLMPIAQVIGGPAVLPIANIISAAGEIGDNALKALEGGQAVSSSRDEALIRAALADLEARNDKLTELVAAS
jgi:hypothetical protein